MSDSRALGAARAITLASYFGLLLHLVLWNTWFEPSRHFPIALVLIAVVLPLLLPLRGILHRRPYTHAWTTFLALFYFVYCLGFVFASNPADHIHGIIGTVLSTGLFVGATVFTRLEARARRAALEPTDKATGDDVVSDRAEN
ncbi:MAG: DUF2069 domain-containing protein [Gammaproteobacteria bacterium]